MKKVLDVFNELPKTIEYNERNVIILDDCINVLKQIKSESIDLIFADPPYNIGKEFEKVKQSKFEYINWCKEWINECLRVLKKSGTFYLTSATQFIPYLDCYVNEKAIVKSRIVWCYDSSGVQAKRVFGSLYEPILMIVKNDHDYVFNLEEIMVKTKMGARKKLMNYRKTPPEPYNELKNPGNVWNIPRVRYKMNEYENHPSQKPEKLLEIIIKASSNPNDIVLDPFGGTFSTSRVASKLDRYSISIEILEKYFKIGLRRLGIKKEYNGEKLIKNKLRITNNKSKKEHENEEISMKNKNLMDFFQ